MFFRTRARSVCGDIHIRFITGDRTLVYKYREGKMKRTLERELNSMRTCWEKADQFNEHFSVAITCSLYSNSRYKI